MNDKLRDILGQQDVDIAQTSDLVGILEDIVEDLFGYCCELDKARTQEEIKFATTSLAWEYKYHNTRMQTLIMLINDRLSDTRDEITAGLESDHYDDTKKE